MCENVYFWCSQASLTNAGEGIHFLDGESFHCCRNEWSEACPESIWCTGGPAQVRAPTPLWFHCGGIANPLSAGLLVPIPLFEWKPPIFLLMQSFSFQICFRTNVNRDFKTHTWVQTSAINFHILHNSYCIICSRSWVINLNNKPRGQSFTQIMLLPCRPEAYSHDAELAEGLPAGNNIPLFTLYNTI